MCYVHILSTRRPFSKNTLVSCPYFVKNINSQKTRCSHIIFFSNLKWKIPCCHTHIWSKKCKFCENYTILWAKKVNRMPFFLICHEKISTLIPYFVKNVQSLNNKQLSYPYLSKNIHSLRTTVLWCHFFQNFSLNTP